jgi:SAM-dependent methyltransferase
MTTQPAQSTRPVDEEKLMAFLHRAVGDFGAIVSGAMVVIGDKLGLYKALAAGGPLTSEELAEQTGTVERYVRDWLVNQAAGGYLEYDAAAGRYSLPPEQALALTNEDSPYCVVGGFQLLTAMVKAEPRVARSFKAGGGVRWGEQDPELFEGCERFFKPGYIGNIVSSWLPALDGVCQKLEAGAMVADVGCGHGASTIIMARAYPKSRFFGFDEHGPSIERARAAAREAGVADRIVFEVCGAGEYPGSSYDLVAFFDCLHDMGDPYGAARHAHDTLAPDGTMLIVEPMAGDKVEDNLNPIGRIYSASSVLCCASNSLACGGPALGTIATDAQLAAVVTSGGFSQFRRATETPFNRVFEARR